ncbi:hypothetical protein [Nonomuraea sp. NEAU-A123]|uniref:hypothetical protein n=1 Tax=Nonomuraea sp. NEAU-A123 TaxID=2839649 RepID=UPI001BE40E6C|nr:hypothetical protein [Nonomuraea sp. NEAU-A123]MBT2227712.1 hypothetical protein [Nonomuraea sp. NEAU-A123]
MKLAGVSRVLLIEDDPAVREGLELALTRAVHRGLEAVSGQAGGGGPGVALIKQAGAAVTVRWDSKFRRR